MSNPSLLCVPYRFKTSTLYSQIPDSGLGDFVVSRSASNVATRVNAQGFIETVPDNVPRLDYPVGGITAGCPALLVEPSAQNLLVRSEEFDNASWSKSNLTATTGSTSAFTAPDGSLTAEALTLTLVSGGHTCNQFLRWPSGTLAVGSIYVKPDTATKFFIANGSLGVGVFFNLSNGTIEGTIGAMSGTISAAGNGYYRITASHTATGPPSQTFQLGIYQTFVSGDYTSTAQFTPSSANLLYVWGAQLETGSVATSYIPTTTAAFTRNADVISVSGAVSGSIGQTEGTIYVEVDVRFLNSTNRRILYISDGTATNSCDIRIDTTNVIRCVLGASTTSGTVGISSSAITTGIIKIAFAYKSGDFALSVNGATALTASGTFTFGTALSNIVLGNQVGGTTFLNDRIRAAALYTTRLTNAELQSLTQ